MSADFGPSGSSLGFPYAPAQGGGGGGAVPLAGDVTGTTAASVVSELQGEVLTITSPLAAGEVLASDAGGTALVNADIATVLGYDPAANLGALGIPDPTGAPDGQVVTTSGGAYVLAAPAGGGPTRTALDLSSATGWTVAAGTGTAAINTGDETADLSGPAGTEFIGNNAPGVSQPLNAEEWEVRGRLVDLSGGASGGARAVLEVASVASGETGVSAVSAWVNPSGQIELLTAVGSGFTSRGNISASLPLNGTGWLRIRRRDGVMSVYHGTGVGTAPPTVWRCTHTVSWAAGDPTVALAHFRVRMLHFGSFYGTPAVVRWADLSAVDLGAPA